MIENRNTNSKIWEIKELSQAIKNTIENSFEFIRLRGEISKPSFPSSGHIYFALKDDMSIINATIWKWNLDSISLKPEEGFFMEEKQTAEKVIIAISQVIKSQR